MNPVLIDLGIIVIKWYSVFIFIALLVGGSYVIHETKRFKISEDEIINMIFWLIPVALIGARLYYVAFNWDYYNINKLEIIQVWNGGLAIHGALIFGLIYLLIYTKRKKINTLRLLDIAVVALLIGQAIGRWGNFMNGEAFGPETTLEFLKGLYLPQFIIDGMYINGAYHQPTFLYESLWCLLGFIIIYIFKHRKYLKLGQLTSFYLVWYGIGRFMIESLRMDSLMYGDFKVAQIVSGVMVLSGIIMYFVCGRGSKFDNLYNEKKRVEFADLPKSVQDLQMKNINQIVNEANERVEQLQARTNDLAPVVNAAQQSINQPQNINQNTQVQQPTQSSTTQQPQTSQQQEPVDSGDAFKW